VTSGGVRDGSGRPSKGIGLGRITINLGEDLKEWVQVSVDNPTEYIRNLIIEARERDSKDLIESLKSRLNKATVMERERMNLVKNILSNASTQETEFLTQTKSIIDRRPDLLDARMNLYRKTYGRNLLRHQFKSVLGGLNDGR